MEDYNTSISGGVLDVLNDICSDESHLYTFSKTALQPIRILEFRRRNAGWSTPLAFPVLTAPRRWVQETMTARRWSGTDLIVNIWHLLEFPGGDDTFTPLYAMSRTQCSCSALTFQI